MAGEVVFNTGMVGYPESLTDPSYRGQILILTYPLVGNYGVPDDSLDESGSVTSTSSRTPYTSAVSSYSTTRTTRRTTRRARSLSRWLQQHNIPALYGIDTRALTKKIRVEGAMLGKITFTQHDSIHYPTARPQHNQPRRRCQPIANRVCTAKAAIRILAVDCGMKNNIIRYFVKAATTTLP